MKKHIFRKPILILPIIFLTGIFFLLINQREKTSSNTLSICTDELMFPHVKNMTEYYQIAIDEQARFEITVIPSSGSEKESVCKKLRTELMSGKGKDIYLLTDQSAENSSGSGEAFLPDVNKTLYSGIWADLMEYLSQDEIFKGCFQPVMNAGKVEDKQYVLPLTFDFHVIKLDGRCDQGGGTLELEDLDPYAFLLSPGIWLGDTIDYEKEKGRVSKEDIRKFLTDVTEKIRQNPLSYQDASVLYAKSESFVHSSNSTAQYTYYPMPSITKNVCAKIESYGAIGRSCRQKEKAYQFLRLFWQEDFADGKGLSFKKNEGSMFFCTNAIYQIDGIPVQAAQWEEWFTNSLSGNEEQKNEVLTQNAASFRKAVEEISTAEFKNALDRIEPEVTGLFLGEDGYQIRVDWPDLERRVEKAANIIYDNIYYAAME